MDRKGAITALILIFLPVCFAIISMITHFEIMDLLYLIFVSTVIVKYYISKKKA